MPMLIFVVTKTNCVDWDANVRQWFTAILQSDVESKMICKVYTSTFTNLSETDSDFVVQIPNFNSLSEIRSILFGMDTDQGLSKDEVLTKIRELFYENVYSNRYHPDSVIENEFTNQSNGKVVLMKVMERNKNNSLPAERSNGIKY